MDKSVLLFSKKKKKTVSMILVRQTCTVKEVPNFLFFKFAFEF